LSRCRNRRLPSGEGRGRRAPGATATTTPAVTPNQVADRGGGFRLDGARTSFPRTASAPIRPRVLPSARQRGQGMRPALMPVMTTSPSRKRQVALSSRLKRLGGGRAPYRSLTFSRFVHARTSPLRMPVPTPTPRQGASCAVQGVSPRPPPRVAPGRLARQARPSRRRRPGRGRRPAPAGRARPAHQYASPPATASRQTANSTSRSQKSRKARPLDGFIPFPSSPRRPRLSARQAPCLRLRRRAGDDGVLSLFLASTCQTTPAAVRRSHVGRGPAGPVAGGRAEPTAPMQARHPSVWRTTSRRRQDTLSAAPAMPLFSVNQARVQLDQPEARVEPGGRVNDSSVGRSWGGVSSSRLRPRRPGRRGQGNCGRHC